MNTYTDMFTEMLKTLDLDDLLPNPETALRIIANESDETQCGNHT